MSKGASRRALLALCRAPGLGPQRIKTILEHIDALEDFLSLKRNDWQRLNLPEKTITYLESPDWRAVDSDLLWAETHNHHLITWFDNTYPPLLRHIATPPPVLYARGNLSALTTPTLAIVGSRRPTQQGLSLAHHFAGALAQNGFAVASGLASGIDGAAHEGALAAEGITLAVMGTGIDVIYPRKHQKLAEQLCERGLLLTEFFRGTRPNAQHFPRRNRIMSGLCYGVLVIEAAIKSGSLITARYARDEGREVFALPGDIHNPLTRGCHHLIREGATLVETIDDILLALPRDIAPTPDENCKIINPTKPQSINRHTKNLEKKTDTRHIILQEVSQTPRPLDVIATRLGLQMRLVASHLHALELEGIVCASTRGYERVVKRT